MNTFIFTVTHYRKYKDAVTKKTEYIKKVYENCYFGDLKSNTTTDNSQKDNSTFICRIPGKVEINPDDVIVKGEIPDMVEDAEGKRIADLVNKYKGKAFYVWDISDNTVLPYFPHTRVSGGV